MRLDKQAHHCDVQNPINGITKVVDPAVIGGRNMSLPGEVSMTACRCGGEVSRSHSTNGNKPKMLNPSFGRLTKREGLNVK